ncbi:peptidylprolyl isomerase [Sphingomonas sp. 28-62-11]|uniref:peptidylprolyl isomerase n=1 Tax=Sphingomonas sp. 28-62-11 TaxID=1970432 RepID=UPI000BD56144|nr:MAG: peptidylprolyl isomerase [Sphingomonas sp. 28-62-11]
MLSFFRRFINSRLGLIVTFAFLAIIAVAFALGDVTGLSSGTRVASGTGIARVGTADVSVDEVKRRTQDEMQNFRQRQPTLDIIQFVNGGGYDAALERLIDAVALGQFGQKVGMVVSKRAVDGQIASVPDLQGPDGKFSQAKYETLLSQRRITDAQIRADIVRSTLGQQLISPTEGAGQVPLNFASPYAALLLEKRAGLVGFVPTNAIGPGDRPTEAEVATYYKRNAARYTVPERRVIRYAMITPDRVKAAATPTEAEIAAAYKTQAARFAASEKRSLAQVVIGDKAGADALVAKVKSGVGIDVAARAAGLEAATLKDIDKAGYTAQTSTEIANAVFAAARGSIVGPIKSPLGWTIIRVDSVQQIAAKSLDQARADLTKEIGAQKLATMLTDLRDRIDDAIADNATFAEIVSDQKLQATSTVPIIADGRDPENSTVTPDPRLAQVVVAGFAAEQGDDPQLAPVGQDGSFAVVSLDRILPAAPPPLAKISNLVVRDFAISRALRKARAIAVDIVAKANKGVPLAQAVAQSPIKLPDIRPVASSRAQLAADTKGAPPPLVLLFSMAGKTAKLLEAPNQSGYYVIYLDQIERAGAVTNPQLLRAMRGDLSKVIGREFVRQFANAVQKDVGVKKNDAMIAQTRKELLGER